MRISNDLRRLDKPVSLTRVQKGLGVSDECMKYLHDMNAFVLTKSGKSVRGISSDVRCLAKHLNCTVYRWVGYRYMYIDKCGYKDYCAYENDRALIGAFNAQSYDELGKVYDDIVDNFETKYNK